MLMGCAGFAAASTTSTPKKEEGPYWNGIFLGNDPNIKGFIEEGKEALKILKTKIGNDTLVDLIKNYKNALDDAAAQDENVKKCLDAYNEAFSKKNETISSIDNIIEMSDKPYLNPFQLLACRVDTQTTEHEARADTQITEYEAIIASLLFLIPIRMPVSLENDTESIELKRLIDESKNNDTTLTDAKKALDKALRPRFQGVIDLDQQLKQYYDNWAKTNYPESELDRILNPIWTRYQSDRNNIISNLAQFTRFDHLKSYDSEVDYSKRKIDQYLAQLEAASKETHEAVAGIQKTI